ncbi:hypothetical protein LXL04_037005 [Taraxacum kok-saghyz]
MVHTNNWVESGDVDQSKSSIPISGFHRRYIQSLRRRSRCVPPSGQRPSLQQSSHPFFSSYRRCSPLSMITRVVLEYEILAYQPDDKVTLWVNKVGPYNNPQETYNFYSLPFCHLPGHAAHKWGGLEIVEKTSVCKLELDEPKVMQFKQAIENNYWFELFMDDLPLWGFVGELHDRNTDNKHMLFTHMNITLQYNKDQIIHVNLTQENPKPLEAGRTLDMTYSVKWTETNITFARRFDVYLDYHFFKHQVKLNARKHHHQMKVNGVDHHDHEEEGFKKEMRNLAEMLSKLNPMAEEFVPPSLSNNNYNVPLLLPPSATAHFGYSVVNDVLLQTNQTPFPNINGVSPRSKGNFTHGKRRMNNRTNLAQREDVIRRTVHISDIDQQVTEKQLAAFFINCGQVVDCRICGDPNSVLRFAFIEFTNDEGARNALSLAGTMLGYCPVRVLPSKTAIAPSEDEREMCARTIYCTNIDKKVTQADVKLFFESFCGEVCLPFEVARRLSSFDSYCICGVMAEIAITALNCSGSVLGSLPIRVIPSKTPVRPRAPRPNMH